MSRLLTAALVLVILAMAHTTQGQDVNAKSEQKAVYGPELEGCDYP